MEEIKKNNNLIAVFMGAKTDVYPKGIPRRVEMFGEWEDNPELSYHCAWDWLMPVVEKIGKEWNVTISIMPTAIDVTTIERPDTNDGEISSIGGMTPIENTYQAVVRFIEWYNTYSKYRTK